MRKPPRCVVKGFIIGKREKISREDRERWRLDMARARRMGENSAGSKIARDSE